MATNNPLNYNVEATKGNRWATCFSQTKNFKRIILCWGNHMETFSGQGISKNMSTESGKEVVDITKVVKLAATAVELPFTVVALISDGFTHNFPIGFFKPLNIDKPKMGQDKFNHALIINCRNASTNEIECELKITVQFLPGA